MKIAFNPSTVAALIAPPNNKDITFDLRGHNIFARGVKFCGTDTNTWRDIKINNVSIDSNILDLRDGDNTTLTNINGIVTINSTWRPVVDNLTSDSTTSSLSANQGRILKALIDGKSNSGHTHDDRYLKLAGGTMTGIIRATNRGGNWISGRDHCLIRSDDKTSSSYWSAILAIATVNGYWTLGHLGDGGERIGFNYDTDVDYNAGRNNNHVIWLPTGGAEGTLALTSDIPTSLKNPYALTISLNGTSQGPYDGSAAKNINITPSSIGAATSDHNHDGRYVRYYAVTTLDCNNLAVGLTAAGVSATNAAHTNHSAYLYISDVGTPFQIQIPDSSVPYIYKRYYSSGTWSEWFKLNAGYADSAGSAIKLETARNIFGLPFDGTNDIGSKSFLIDSNIDTDTSAIKWTAKIVSKYTSASTGGQGLLIGAATGRKYCRGGGIAAYATNVWGNNTNLAIYKSQGNDYDIKPVEVITITENLNVGIGTTRPSSKLTVAGSITPTSANVYNIGTSGNFYNTIYSRVLCGETTSTSIYHQIAIGYPGHDRIDFDERGGAFYFNKTSSSSRHTIATITLGGLFTTDAITYGLNGLQYFNQITGTTSGATNNANPYNDWFHIIRMNHGDADGYFVDLATAFHQDAMYFRRIVSGQDNGWRKILHDGNSYVTGGKGVINGTTITQIDNATNADTVDGIHANQLCRIYTFNVHNSIIKVGTLTSGQYGHVCKLRFNSGIGYNAGNQDKTMTVVIRASNGGANSNGFYFEAHSESYRGGAFTTFYLHQTSKTQCELYMAAFNHSGQSTYEVSFSAGDSWVNEISVQNALPTSNMFTLSNYQIAYADYTVASATKLQTPRTIWGQSFDGTENVDGTLRIRQTTGNYCEGIRIQTADSTWATIILGATGDSGTNANAWSIHRKADNNFAISRNSSDGTNGLVMTSVGMGLGTISPEHRLDVVGNIRATGQIIREGSGQAWVNGRNGALLRETSVAGYHTLWSLKTTNGSWDFGEYNAGSDWNNIPVLSYITDSNYNSGNNTTTYQIKFPLASGTVALTSNIPNPTNYYWANVKISTSSSTTTSPTVLNLTATNSIRMGNILLEHTNEINNSANDSIHLNLRNSGDVSLCVGGGKVGIGTMYPSQELYVLGYTHTKGFGIGIQYLSESELLPTISPGDGYAYRCLEIGRPTKVSCIIADKVPLSGVRGILLKFMQGFDGQIVLLKDLENYGSGNGYFWVMPSGCKIIKADNSNILINQNQISNTYDDGRSRFFIYSSKYSAWIEFLCSNIY